MPKGKTNQSNNSPSPGSALPDIIVDEVAYPSVTPDGEEVFVKSKEVTASVENQISVKWLYLSGAYANHELLTGTVSGFEEIDGMNPLCIVEYEGVRIIVPASEMFMESWQAGTAPPPEMIRRIKHLLGAKINFILLGIDRENEAAVGSRREAMLKQQAKYYKTGRVVPGAIITCNVISVGSNSVVVDALGVDSSIPASRLTWEWFADITEMFAPGDEVLARVLSIQPDPDTGRYRVKLSVKAAIPNPDLASLRKLVPGCNYYGTVASYNKQTVFIRLQVGVNATSTVWMSKEIPARFDTVSFQLTNIDEDQGIAHGVITRIIRKNSRER